MSLVQHEERKSNREKYGLPPSMDKRTVLDETEYVQRLEKLIQRDYFPELPKLKAQNEYLEALQKNDHSKIRELQMRYSRRRTDQLRRTDTPGGFDDTPLRASADFGSKNPAFGNVPSGSKTSASDISQATSSAQSVVDKDLTVDQFLSKFVSEDNASYGELIEEQEIKHRLKYHWVFDAEKKHIEMHEAPLAVEGLSVEEKQKMLETWSYKSKNPVLWVPEAVEWTEEEKVKRRKMAQKQVIAQNTRFKEPQFVASETTESMSKASSAQAAANLGRVDIQGEKLTFNDPSQKYSFVATPSPAPGVQESPFMTWGEIEGTPFCLDASDNVVQPTPGPSFKIPELPKRDQIAEGLIEQSDRHRRERKQKALRTLATPKFGSVKSVDRLNSMSPAARRLATSKLGIRVNSDKALKASYTPSPSRKTPTPYGSKRVTPKRALASERASSSASSEFALNVASKSERSNVSVTDNLLLLDNKKL